jgi:signal peptidase I
MATEALSLEGVQHDLAEETLRSFGGLRSVVRGTSMLPSIFPGDILFIRREIIAKVRCGDVVLFRQGRYLCTHRVVRNRDNGEGPVLITRGDASARDDSPVSEKQMLGRVMRVLRGRKQFELTERPTRWNRIVGWGAAHSEGVVSGLLRWHGLRMRFSERFGDSRSTVRKESPECT